MALLNEIAPYLKTIPKMTEDDIKRIPTKEKLLRILKKNKLIDKIPLSIQLKYDFIILQNIPKQAMKYKVYNKGYLTVKELIQCTPRVNWNYSNNTSMEKQVANLVIKPDNTTNVEELNIKEVAIYNLYRAGVAYDNLIEDFKNGKLEDDVLFQLLEQSLKKFYEKNNKLESMVDAIKYCYENNDKNIALYNMACLSVLVDELNMKVIQGKNSFFDYGINNCKIVIDGGTLGNSEDHYHELGHAIHFKLKGRKIPEDIKRIVKELVSKNIDEVDEFLKNIDKYYRYNMSRYHQKIQEWRKKYQESCRNKLTNIDRNSYPTFLKEVRKLCKSEEIYQDLLVDLDFFLPEEEYSILDEKEYQNRLQDVLDCLFDYNNTEELDRNVNMKLSATTTIIGDLLSGIYLNRYNSEGFGLNYPRFHSYDYYYDYVFEMREEDAIFDELFANYNVLRITNQKLPLELVQLLGEELFQNLISVYEGIPKEKVELEKYITSSPIITKEIKEYKGIPQEVNQNYFEREEESMDFLRLDKIHMIDAQCSEEIKKYGRKEGNRKFFNMLLNYYERNVENFDTRTLEIFASYSDGEIINVMNRTIEKKDRNEEPIFTEEEKRKLEKRRDEVLYDRAKILKEEGLLENQPFPVSYLAEEEKTTYNDKLFEVDEGYLDYNNPNTSKMEYYKKYLDRFNIAYFANITLEDDSIVSEISDTIYNMFDNDQYDITNIKNVFITKEEKRKQETEEERKEGTLVFKYDEPLSEIKQRLQEQCKKEAKSK